MELYVWLALYTARCWRVHKLLILFQAPSLPSLPLKVWQHGSAAARRAARLSSSQVTQFRLHFGLSIEHFMSLGAATDAAVDVVVVVVVDHLP